MASYSTLRVQASLLNEKNYVGVDNLLQDRQGKTDSTYIPKEGNWTAYKEEDILIGNIRPYLKKIWFSNCEGGTNGDVLVVSPDKQLVSPKYLYYILSSDEFFAYDMQFAKGAKMPRGNKEAILRYEFCLPKYEEQAKIVSILDKFDTLVNDISQGLPAEIEARQKQYEYYRDKLLTFKEIS